MNPQNQWQTQMVNAIPHRHSVRTYRPEALPKELTEKMKDFIEHISPPFAHAAKIEMFQAEPGKKLYNNGVNPVDNLALLSQTDLLSISKTGFLGELVMLYAVSLGVSTCWFGHYRLSEVGKYIPGIATKERIKESTLGYGYGRAVDVGERVICCMPFGSKDTETKRLVDFVAGKNGARRKNLADLLEDPQSAGNIPSDIKEVLELAKLAPSAANSQMWRFGFDDAFAVMTVAKPVGYRHFKWEHPDVDIGMCAAHAWLGLLAKGYTPTVSVALDADRARWSFALS